MAIKIVNTTDRRLLLADWFKKFAEEKGVRFTNLSGPGDSKIEFAAENQFKVVAHFIEEEPFLRFESTDGSNKEFIDETVSKAVHSLESQGFGGSVWYSTSLVEVSTPFSTISTLMVPMIFRLGKQTRIAGWRRLGTNILLEFVEETTTNSAKLIFAPKVSVNVHISVPGPCYGFFSSSIANSHLIETISCISSFAVGRQLTFPPSVQPTKSDIPVLDQFKSDPKILPLTRHHVSLDIFSVVVTDGGLDFYNRARSSLLTFDAATRENNGSVAMILYVAAAESLTVPNASWKFEKLTKRFIKFFDELMSAKLDQMIEHEKFEETFGIQKGEKAKSTLRRKLLEKIYSYRSGELHEGLKSNYQGFGMGVNIDIIKPNRVAMIADFAETAILKYLRSPRSTLIGHPALEGQAHYK